MLPNYEDCSQNRYMSYVKKSAVISLIVFYKLQPLLYEASI